MLTALLEGETPQANTGWVTWVVLGVVVVIFVVFFVISSRKNKKRQEENEQLMNAIKPGNKVKTIGGVCGIVVEVDPEENTFVLETGSEVSGKSYMKFDKQAIYQTDAVVEKPEDKNEEAEDKSGEPFEEGQAEEKAEEKQEEQPAQDAAAPADGQAEEKTEE